MDIKKLLASITAVRAKSEKGLVRYWVTKGGKKNGMGYERALFVD